MPEELTKNEMSAFLEATEDSCDEWTKVEKLTYLCIVYCEGWERIKLAWRILINRV